MANPEENMGLDALKAELDAAPVAAEPSAPENAPDPTPDAPDRDQNGQDGRPTGQIFEGSPVTALGLNGDFCFYIDVSGQMRSVKKHELDAIRSLYGGRVSLLARHFPQYDKEGAPRRDKFDQANAAAAMVQACQENGIWSEAHQLRQIGFWRSDDGELVVHAGDQILVNGEWCDPGRHGNKVYSAGAPVPRPAPAKSRGAGQQLHDYLASWNWQRGEVDVQLLLGFIMSMIAGGALSWRPMGWIAGDAASGKSSLLDNLIQHIFGDDAALVRASNATAAGLRARLENSSVPVVLDEFEPTPERPERAREIIELARHSASGGVVLRGSSNQESKRSSLQSAFLFASILVSDIPAQDRSRLLIFPLERLPKDAKPPRLVPRDLRLLGQHLRQRLVDGWPQWDERLEAWQIALADAGHTGREACDNYGTVLALADLALHDELPSQDVLAGWIEKIGPVIKESKEETGSNSDDMLFHLFNQTIDPFRRGEVHTVSQWIMAAAQLPGAPAELLPITQTHERAEGAKKAQATLRKIGLAIDGKEEEARLFFPNKPFAGLCDLFANTQWNKGNWSQAAKRIDGATMGNKTIFGVASRGVSVPILSMPSLLAFPTGRDTPTTPSDGTPSDINDFG